MNTMEAQDFGATRQRGRAPSIRARSAAGTPGAVQLFRPHERIYEEGAQTQSLYRVISGTARSVKTLRNGRRLVCGFHFKGDVFGLEYAPAHSETAEAVSDCEIAVIPRSQLQDIGHGGGELWRLTCEALKRAQAQMLLLGRKSAEERVASFLLDLMTRQASPIQRSHGQIDLPMTRFDIADHLGLTMETVSRVFSRLERDGVLAILGPRHIKVLDADRLERCGE